MRTGPWRRPWPCTRSNRSSTTRWDDEGLPSFGLGLGVSTGAAAAALLGSEERLEYTLVGDTVNMSQRLQQLAEAGETVVSQGTVDAWRCPRGTIALPPQLVKGRETPVVAYKLVDGARPGGGTYERRNLTWMPWS